MISCEECKAKRNPESVPFIVHESAMARAERSIKRLTAVIVLLIVLLVGSNAGWIWYEAQFEKLTVTQDNADGINNFIGNDGDILNGTTND